MRNDKDSLRLWFKEAKRIREIREQLGVTQVILAKLCDVSEPYISMIERGQPPSEKTYKKIVEFLEGKDLRKCDKEVASSEQ